MKSLCFKYPVKMSMRFHLHDSKALHFSVTIASSPHFKEPPLLRGSGSSSFLFEKIWFLRHLFSWKWDIRCKKLFFEPVFSALQPLHFNFNFNKNQYSKRFHVVTSLVKCFNSVTKRNRYCNTVLHSCYKSLVTRLVKSFSYL